MSHQRSANSDQPKLFRSVFCILYSVLILCGCQDTQKLYTDNLLAMGTFVEVTSPDKRAAGIVFDEIQRLDKLLSKYYPQSEVFRLNEKGKLNVSEDTFYIIKKSKEISALTEGAFDITVAPLVDLWGFTKKDYSFPSREKIRQRLEIIGSDKILLNDFYNVIQFKFRGMKIDLGAIAKGYALDCAVKKLKENNINSCLIDIGGQIYALGRKFNKPWRVAIRNPRGGYFIDYLGLTDQCVATSGDYEQYFIKKGKRYAHIIDPRTGYPAQTEIASVTVVAQEGLIADALATAVFVLGKEKGRELVAEKFPGVELEIVDAEY